MRMFAAAIDLELGKEPPAKTVLGQHSMHGHFEEAFGAGLQELTGGSGADAAWKAGMAMVNLVGQLFAGQLDLGRIDDDDEVTRILVGREVGAVFAAQGSSGT